MSGLVLAAGVPFLGPAIAAWIVLIVAVMGGYYLMLYRQHRREPPRGRVSGSPTRTDYEAPAPNRDRELTRPWLRVPDPMPERSDYDMEHYPADKWTSSTI